MSQSHTYNEERKRFFGQFNYFFADVADLEYALYDTMSMSQDQVNEIHYASTILWKIFTKVSKQFKKLDDSQLLSLGIREEIIPYITLDYLPQQSVLARFDFICTEDGGIKAIELNGDTPFLIQETFEINAELCEEFGLVNPNNEQILVKSLSAALLSALDYLKERKERPVIVITGKDEEEDYEEFCQVNYIHRILPFDIEYVTISDLIIVPKATDSYARGLYTPSMKKIDVLYRPAHPIEFLIDDVAEDGDRIGLHLLDLVKDRELAIINSPAAILLQSKILLWLIWEKRNDPLLFTSEERDAINRYMLPTYISSAPFLEKNQPYVKKPVYSREGNTVEIFKGDGNQWLASEYAHYTDNIYIYQQYIEMPTIDIQLKDGKHTKKWLVGSFIADNKACGIACRVGSTITDWYSHFMSIGIKNQSK